MDSVYLTNRADNRIRDFLKFGGVGVLPTDTIYGLVGSAFRRKTVGRIYRLRKRNQKKPMIILIGSLNDLKIFNVTLDSRTKNILKKNWPGPVSIILPLNPKRHTLNAKLKYLHRGTKTLAFRLPKPRWLNNFLIKTGPLVAPSANREGFSPAENVKEAKKYFSNKIDFYVDKGKIAGKSSRLIKIENGRIEILRK